uniref:Reverse transcriptase domain-containing protein n=1 Tax=Tanacetum cinerariifolium TaxID=118510 RepID=A0A6L2K1B1_TANCI|nr:reverse transcriptase domain-containing protein [Tanacetum cinerariifolium]
MGGFVKGSWPLISSEWLASHSVALRTCVINKSLLEIFHVTLSVMVTTTNFAQRSDFVHLDGFGLGEMSSYHTLDLIFELDETTVRWTRDIMRHRDSLDRFSEISWLATGHLVNGSPCDRIDMIIENLDMEPKIDAMVRDFLESPSRWKELRKEMSSKILASGDGSRRKTLKLIASLIRNEHLQTKLEYFNKDYDEEREMEPRLKPNLEATSTLWPRSHVVRRQQERTVGFEEASNTKGSRRGRNVEGGHQPSTNMGGISLLMCMRTRSSSNRIVKSFTIPRRCNKRSQQQVVPTIVEILIVMMADNRTMGEMLQAPTKGYGDAIVSNNPHDRIRSFNRITSTLKFRNVPNDAIKLMLFPYSLEGAAKIWYEKEPPRSILTWGDLTPRDALTIIENKSKVRYSQNKPVASKVSTTSSGSSSSMDARIDKLTDTISNLVETFNKKMTTPATVKAVEETCVICGGVHPYYDCIVTDSNTSSACTATSTYNQRGPQNRTSNQMGPPGFPPVFSNEFVHYKKTSDDNMRIMRNQMNNMKTEFQSTLRSQNNKIDQNQNEIKNMLSYLMNNPSGSRPLPSNTIANLRGDLKEITPRSGVSSDGPPIPLPFSSLPKVVERVPVVTKDTVQPNALLHKPKFSLMFKSLLNNKEKLFNLATTLVNENCSAVILKELLEKLRDPGKFLIPCDFLELVECLALVDLGASINLMPLSIWKKLSLPELTPTRMILELANRLTTRPAGIAEDPSIEEPPELELKELPSHLEYAFLEGIDKLPIIVSKELKDKEKFALLKVLKLHKRAIAWKISDIKGIDPRFCTHKFLMEDDFKPTVQHQRRVNLKIHEVIKKEVIKLLDAGLIYLFSIAYGLENPHQDELEKKEITETFPLETLGMIAFRGDSSTPWFADISNYHAGSFIVKGMSSQQKKKFFKDVKHYFWDDPYLFKICAD